MESSLVQMVEARTRAALAAVPFENWTLELEGIAGRPEGIVLTVRLCVFDSTAEGVRAIRDIKEQEIRFSVSSMEGAERLSAFLEGLMRALPSIAALNDTSAVDTLMPHDLLLPDVFGAMKAQTADEFAALLSNPEERAKLLPDPEADVGDISGTEPIARSAELEAAIGRDPENAAPYLVYADWLEEQGDPRGELIVCQAPDASPTARDRASDLLMERGPYLVGNLRHHPDWVRLTWRFGFIDSVHLSADYELAEKQKDFVTKALQALLQLPAGAFLRSLTVGCFNFDGQNDYDAILEILARAGAKPSMRSLFLGDMTSEESEISWTSAGSLDKIRGLYPNLRELKIHTGKMSLGHLDYPQLESLVIESGGLAKENVHSIGAARWPALQALTVWFGSSSYGGDATVEDAKLLLAPEHFPRLRRLGLCNSEHSDAIAQAVVDSPLLPQLEELDLSMGTLSDEGGAVLLQNKARLSRLRVLDVSRNYLSAAVVKELETLCPTVLAGQQQDAGGEDRYVSVSE